jgi:hypothetical protein
MKRAKRLSTCHEVLNTGDGSLTPRGRDAILQSTEYLCNRSVIIVGHDGGEPVFHGTGVCVQVAGRYFIATAAHHFLNPASDSLLFLPDLPREGRGTDVAFKPMACGYRGGGPKDALDIAWLEVSPTSLRRLAKEFVPLARLAPLVRLAPGDRVFVYGYPEEPVRSEAGDGQGVHGFKAIGYATMAIDPEARLVAPPPDVDTDAFIAYPRELNDQAPEGWLRTLPPPAGISGAGVWRINWWEGGGWAVEELQLVALQHAWHREAACLRGTRIAHWLKMIVEDFPELHAHVATAFPGLL